MAALMMIILGVFALNATKADATSLAHTGMSGSMVGCLAPVLGVTATDPMEGTIGGSIDGVDCLRVPGFNMVTPRVYLAAIDNAAGNIAVAMTRVVPAMNNAFVVNFDYMPVAGAKGKPAE
jgi:hypothetical protein